MGSDGLAKLTDFGLSAAANTLHQGSVTGAIRWVAPECLRGEPSTLASDIYSFGMCIYQAVSGKEPWENKNPSFVRYLVKKDNLPPRPAHVFTNAQWEMVEHMCASDPAKRLHILVVVQLLKQLANPNAK